MSGLDGRPSAGCGSAWVHRSSSSSGWWGWRPRTRGPRGACGSGTGRGGRLGGGVRRAAPRSPPWSGPVLVVLEMVDLTVGDRLFTPRCSTPPVSGDDRPPQRCRACGSSNTGAVGPATAVAAPPPPTPAQTQSPAPPATSPSPVQESELSLGVAHGRTRMVSMQASVGD